MVSQHQDSIEREHMQISTNVIGLAAVVMSVAAITLSLVTLFDDRKSETRDIPYKVHVDPLLGVDVGVVCINGFSYGVVHANKGTEWQGSLQALSRDQEPTIDAEGRPVLRPAIPVRCKIVPA